MAVPVGLEGRARRRAAFGVLPLAVVFSLFACSSENDLKNRPTVTVAMEATAVNSLIYIAQENGYFAEHGIQVIIKDDYPSGAAATAKMLEGEADISTTAEFAIVRYAFAGTDIRALGSIDMFMHMKLIARKDRGIVQPSDLRGKRIGVPLKTAADFKLGRFLDLHRLDRKSLTVVDVQAPEAVQSLVAGAVDGVVTWQPNVMEIADRLGEKAVVWDVQSGQPMYCTLMATEKWVADHPEPQERFLRALLRAEKFLIDNGDTARSIVSGRLGYDDRYIDAIWAEHRFSLRLDQSLILAMEDQARWMRENGLTSEEGVPDFLKYLHAEGLKQVKPEAVSLIRLQ